METSSSAVCRRALNCVCGQLMLIEHLVAHSCPVRQSPESSGRCDSSKLPTTWPSFCRHSLDHQKNGSFTHSTAQWCNQEQHQESSSIAAVSPQFLTKLKLLGWATPNGSNFVPSSQVRMINHCLIAPCLTSLSVATRSV